MVYPCNFAVNKTSAMSKIAKQLTDLVGNTPLLELSNFNAFNQLPARVIAKLEYFNPAGSVKDRIALSMITDAEEKGAQVRRHHH
jgi:cysteine synthase